MTILCRKHLAVLAIILCGIFPAQQKAILRVMQQQQEAWNRGDLDGYMQGYLKSDSLVFIGSNGPTYGWDTTLANYRKSYPTRDRMGVLSFSGQRVTMLGKNYATVLGYWHLRREHDEPKGIYTLIFRRFPEGWRIIQDHTQ